MKRFQGIIGFVMAGAVMGGFHVPRNVSAQETKTVFVYEDHGKRDPLWPLVSPAGNIVNYETEFQVTDLKLEGIISAGEGQNLAIINGRIVQTNDPLGPFTVMGIGSDSVTLGKDQQTFELRLKKEE
jgi:hypothetical protein